VTETNVFQLSQPGTFADPLTEVLRNGARALLAQAVEAEVAALLSAHADNLTDDGRQRLVRHGHLPEREIMTGIGPVAVTERFIQTALRECAYARAYHNSDQRSAELLSWLHRYNWPQGSLKANTPISRQRSIRG
jgi:hypothetical protein